MIPRPEWHPGEDALQAYVDGAPGPALAASVEAHLLDCGTCRVALAPAVGPARLAVIKAGLDDRLDAAERPALERLLCRLGVVEADARVMLAAPSMRRAWWLAVFLALAFASLAALQDPARAEMLLVLAPLLPVVTTAVSYAPRLDPVLAMTAATPYPAMRLLLLRAGAVAVASSLLALVASLAVPVGVAGTLVWLLPAAALTAATVALSTWVDAVVAAGTCCAGWLTAVWTVGRGLDPLAVYDAAGQLVSIAVLLTALGVLALHRHRLDPGSPA